jgi:uncharacterized protein YjbI with pentapeptide repeats
MESSGAWNSCRCCRWSSCGGDEAFKEQNQKLQMQIDQQADQDTARRRTEIIAVLYETTRGVSGALEPRANPRTRAEATLEFVRLERQRLTKLRQRGPEYQQQVSFSQARLDGLNLDNADFSEVSLVGAFLENTSFHRANLQGADLRASQLVSTSFRNAVVARANFEGSSLLQVSMAHADLREGRLNSVSLIDCEFLGADLRGAELNGLRALDRPSSFRFANIAGAKGLEPQLRELMLSQGAVEIADDAAWKAFRAGKGLR